jgi:hypothetical protein
LFQTQIFECNYFCFVFMKLKWSFLFLQEVDIVAVTVNANSIRSDNGDPNIIPISSNLRGVTKLDVIWHSFGDVIDGEMKITAFKDFDKSGTGP